jgi:signal transduction histidine kinase
MSRAEPRTWPAAAALAAVTLALAAGSAYVATRHTDSQVEARRRDRRAAAEALATQLRPWFVRARSEISALAGGIAARGGVVASADLDALAASAPAFDLGVYVVDRTGLVVAASGRASVLLRVVRRGPPIDAAIAGRLSFSGIVTDPLRRRPEVRVAAPLPGAPRGAVAVVGATDAVTGSVAPALVAAARAGPVTQLVVTPDDRVVEAAGGTAAATQDVVAPARAGRRGATLMSYDGEGSVARLAGAAPIAGGWVVVVAGERAAVVAGPRGDLYVAAGLALAAALVAVAGLLGYAGRLRRQARRSEQDRVAMLTVAGHELRTPLTQILGSAQLLTRRWAALDDSRRQQLLTGVAQQARTLDRLIERLLHAGRLAAGQARGINLRPVDVAAVAREAAADVLSPVHRVTVHAAGPVLVQGDPAALRQVLGHLLDNAVKYSPDGGPIEVTVTAPGMLRRRAEIAVTDEGVGLPADTSRIFERFVQGEAVDTRVHDEGGVGLGLAIVSDLVTAMHGEVRAERRPTGARFVVDLPAVD